MANPKFKMKPKFLEWLELSGLTSCTSHLIRINERNSHRVRIHTTLQPFKIDTQLLKIYDTLKRFFYDVSMITCSTPNFIYLTHFNCLLLTNNGEPAYTKVPPIKYLFRFGILTILRPMVYYFIAQKNSIFPTCKLDQCIVIIFFVDKDDNIIHKDIIIQNHSYRSCKQELKNRSLNKRECVDSVPI